MNKLILIIDDDADDREVIETSLSNAGFDNIISAKSGEEGIDLAKENKPEIVITDTNLPKMNGFETCKAIKGIEGLNAKVIVMTGHVDAVDAGKAREFGADDYCVKTSDFSQLITILNQMCEQSLK